MIYPLVLQLVVWSITIAQVWIIPHTNVPHTSSKIVITFTQLHKYWKMLILCEKVIVANLHAWQYYGDKLIFRLWVSLENCRIIHSRSGSYVLIWVIYNILCYFKIYADNCKRGKLSQHLRGRLLQVFNKVDSAVVCWDHF